MTIIQDKRQLQIPGTWLKQQGDFVEAYTDFIYLQVPFASTETYNSK